MDTPRNPPLLSIRKAIARNSAFIEHCKNVRPHHRVTLQALRLAEAMLEAGFDLDQVTLAIKTVGRDGCNHPVPGADQRLRSDVLHADESRMEMTECLSNGRPL